MDIIPILLKKIKNIVADGDWDGVVATGLLIRFARKHGIEPIVEFPHPRTLRTRSFNNVVAIEITPTKTKIENSVIIDHHEKVEGYNNVWIFDSNVDSVAELIVRELGLELDKDFLEAINNLDQGRWKASELTRVLFMAFQKNPEVFPRLDIAYMVADDRIKDIIEWARDEARGFEPVIRRAQELMDSIQFLAKKPSVVYFVYDVKKEQGARRLAMLELEEIHDIVIALGVENERFVTGTIATMKSYDLSPIFKMLRERGFNAGGRANVGGFQGNLELNEVIKVLREILSEYLSRLS